MQTQMVLLQFAGGAVGVMQLVLDDGRSVKQVASAATIEREIARSALPEPVVSWRLITKEELPSSRRWRSCWRDRNNSVEVDMTLARNQRLQELRAERDAALELLDRDWMRAAGQGKTAEAAQIEAQRQALRDMPKRVQSLLDAAKTPMELEQVN